MKGGRIKLYYYEEKVMTLCGKIWQLHAKRVKTLKQTNMVMQYMIGLVL